MRYNRGMERIHISHHDRTMDARLCLPAKKNFPVVVISHGFGGSCEDFAPLAGFLQKKGAGALSFTFCGSGKQDLSGFPHHADDPFERAGTTCSPPRTMRARSGAAPKFTSSAASQGEHAI